MKKTRIKKIWIIAITFFLISTLTVYADSGYVYYNPNSDLVVFSGEADSALPVTVYAYKEENDYKIFRLVNTRQGKIEFIAEMPDSAAGGEYTGKIVLPLSEVIIKFPYAKTPAVDITAAARNAVTEKSLDSFILSHASDIGIDAGYYNQNKASINKNFLLFANNFPNNLSVVKAFYSAICYTKIIGAGNTEIISLLSTMRGYTDFDFDVFITKTAEIKTGITAKLSTGDISDTSFVKIAGQADFLSYLQYGTRWNDLKIYINNTYRGFFPNINFTALNSLKMSDNLYINILGSSYTKISDFETEFNKRIDVQAKSEQSGGQGTGNGSIGGGGGGGGRVEIVQQIKDDTTENKEESALFNDLGSNHWAYAYVKSLTERGIIKGDGNGAFRPDSFITRAEFTKIIAEAFLSDSSMGENNFTDVEAGSWYEAYIRKAVFSGIIKGYPNNSFLPNDNISRQDMAVILNNVIKAPKKTREFESFVDYNDISDYASEAVENLFCAGVINGMDDNLFMPKDNLTRAQAATAVYLAERSVAD